MQDKELYQQILGLNSPWSVSDVELDHEASEMGMSRWLLKLDDGLAWVKGILFRSGGKRARRNSSR